VDITPDGFVCIIRGWHIQSLRLLSVWIALLVVLLLAVGIKRVITRTGGQTARGTKVLNAVLFAVAIIYSVVAWFDRRSSERFVASMNPRGRGSAAAVLRVIERDYRGDLRYSGILGAIAFLSAVTWEVADRRNRTGPPSAV
jgi:hypothetical protein